MMKVIAVVIDNVLNNFDATLTNTAFEYNKSYGLSHKEFNDYLAIIKNHGFAKSKFLITKFSDFRYHIHEQCYDFALANPDAIEFMHWLKANGWTVIICTKRDLRLTGLRTKKWLRDHQIPYNYLVMTSNTIVFCKLWNIPYLIDDDLLNITYGDEYDIKVYYPIMDKHNSISSRTAKGFAHFEEIKQWI